MNWIISFALSFLCAGLSALGMGGGGLLLIYLTAYAGINQMTAQGINLVFFIPIAIISLFFHAKNKLIRWDIAIQCVILGIPGVYFGWKLATLLDTELLSRLFGGFLLIIGIREMFSKPKEPGKSGEGKKP